MKRLTGRTLSLSLPRRMLCDMLGASRQLDLVMFERRMHLGPLIADRARAKERPSLLAMFIKAFAVVAARRPELRRVFASRPWHRLYEYDQNLIKVVIERDYEGESALFLAPLDRPEQMALGEIDARLRKAKEAPIENTGRYGNALRLARLPLPIRRLFWSLLMKWMPKARGRFLGTMGFSVTASMGGAALVLLTPWTTTVCYGVLDEAGSLDVRISFDHRVYDGKLIAAATAEVERELLGSIRTELLGLRRAAA